MGPTEGAWLLGGEHGAAFTEFRATMSSVLFQLSNYPMDEILTLPHRSFVTWLVSKKIAKSGRTWLPSGGQRKTSPPFEESVVVDGLR